MAMTTTTSAPALLAYVSGHGFGHFTRSQAVLERLVALAPATPIHLRTSAPALRLAQRSPFLASVARVDVGPGVAQRGPLAVDVAATRAALQQHLDEWERTVEEEVAFARAAGARLVYADVPPIAFAVAARAGIPSVALANFSWSWIYEGYRRHDPWFSEAAERLRAVEGGATLCLALAMGGGLDAFPRRIEVAPVARLPGLPRAEVRRRLGLEETVARPMVLLSFGGFGDQLDLGAAAARSPQLDLVTVSAKIDRALPNLQSVEPSASLTHPDLVAAADCVLGKPGYGTVAECLHRPTPLVYVPRGDFREYAALVDAIHRWLPGAALAPDDLLAGRWSAAVAQAMHASAAESPPRADGAGDAAARLLALLA
jgi:L-arabinokinase